MSAQTTMTETKTMTMNAAKSISSLWHELLRQLSYEQREAWRQKGFPSDAYSTEPCGFCDTVKAERNRIELRAKERFAKAEQIAQDAVAKASQLRQHAAQYENAPLEVRELIGVIKTLAERDVHIELPPAPDVTVNINKDAIRSETPFTVNMPPPQDVVLEYEDEH